MSTVTCLRCKETIDGSVDQCPHCGEKVTLFQRTYAARLLDGKYQILDRLGIGGMGEIFKVRHIHLNELRVIKIMRPNVAADDQGLQRFLQEARTSTMIKHKNLAMLYDFSTLEDGSYYMVWEFIDGTNIQRWIAQNGPVPPRLAVEMSIQALHGLDHLHSMGLIHRDISPENIMLSQDHHGKLAVKVIDFGIAKQLAEGDGGQGLTQTGMFLGKLKYASPEQAGFLKEGEHIDPRSDLYSFGIVLYEMLAGRAPFQATNPHGYILKHVTEKPAAIHDLNPAVTIPPELEAITFKSLEKNRENRYATAADFAAALEAIRSTIQPDPKFGLGEKMITLSGAQTLADLPKVTTGSFTGGSSGTQAGQTSPALRGGTIGSNDATVMEPGLKTGAGRTLSGSEPTQMERKGAIGNDDATVMEKLGTTTPGTPLKKTVATPSPQQQEMNADATVIERQMQFEQPKPKKNIVMISAIAAVLAIAIGIGVLVMRKPAPGPDIKVVTTGANSGTSVTVPPPPPILPAGQGALLLSAAPWGEIEKIVKSDDQKPVDLSEEKRITPTRIELQPGKYLVTVISPAGAQTIDVNIEAGKQTRKTIGTFGPDQLNDLEKEVNPQ
ncbi:MAG: serine/threonine-protein kinase [Acidobacteriota bacterium]